ncbi:nucleic acid-binding protein [Salinarchaeum laminariae]|uniref:nucleic acid-binding protein n=1 Tax=Salinarchaeum laminariae TaxID=869888 RepID=UPI0020C06B46|nr:nucleic acid-binding protein [Salinarchaeum laminariae]
MSEDDRTPKTTDGGTDAQPPFAATRYESGAISYPGHPTGPEGTEPAETVDLAEYTAEVVTWTTSTATPPGVRQPNHLAIVEFEVPDPSGDDVHSVRALGQLTTDGVETGDEVRPVYVEELREPGVGIKDEDSAQDWDGYRFEPV